MTNSPSTVAFPHIYGKDGNRRADIERRLNAQVQVGSLFNASIEQNGKTYRIVTAGGSEFKKVTLREADMICSAAISAYYQGKAHN